jgi:tetratricopeptide (TPR) repeat protein
VDILPTVLDLLEMPTPGVLDGVSLRPLLLDPDHNLQLTAYIETQYPRLQFGWAPLSGLRNEQYKYVNAPRPELYDLMVDPHETRNLVDEQPDLAEKFLNDLKNIRSQADPTNPEAPLPDRETVARLRSLGYVTSAVDTETSTSIDDLEDPKDKIDVVNRLNDARVARREGDSARALELLVEVLEDDPDVMLAHLTLGNIHLDDGEADKATASFKKVLARNQDNLEALLGFARADKMQGRYRESAEKLERCLVLDPTFAVAAQTLAEVRLALGQGQEAEALMSRLPSNGRQSDVSNDLLLANSLLAQRKNDEAIEILRRIEQRGSRDEDVLLSLGSLYLKAGQEERGIATYRLAVKAPLDEPNREQAELFNAIGHLLARHGDLSSAALAFQKAVRQDPSLASGHNNLGIVLARINRFEEAERAFQQAIDKAPDFAEAHYNLGSLYLQTQRIELAITCLRQALALKPDYDKARSKLEQALVSLSDNR